MMTKILYVCSVPALESYSAGVISAAFSSKKMEVYAYIFLEGTDRRSIEDLLNQYSIPEEKKSNVIFARLDSNKFIRILSAGRYLSKAADFATENDVKIIHFISQDVMLSGHLRKFDRFKVFYTVHDLIPHEVRLNLFCKLKHYYLRIRKDKMLTRQIPNLVTNSLKQLELLEQLFPQKNVRFHQMPGLVTPMIRSGEKKIQQLIGINRYVLFFGKIELYKGLEKLYNIFTADDRLKNQSLVIAGSGDIYFRRNRSKEKNIIFINRYIEDREINFLFSNACMLVLPYISATQSAVSSLAYHYHLPVISSDVEGLKDSITEQTGIIYHSSDPNALVNAILQLLNDPELRDRIKKNVKSSPYFYQQNDLKNQIEGIYGD